jgi:hypothetical protein
MGDWLDNAALSFVKESAARTTVMGTKAQKSGFGSSMSRMGSPRGIAPTPRPVRNPQTRATPAPPKPTPPRVASAVTLPRSMNVPAPPKLVTSSVAQAFFKGVMGTPKFLWRATPGTAKAGVGLGLAGFGTYKAGKGLAGHFRGVQAARRANLPQVRRQQQLYDTLRYGATRSPQ